MLVMMGQKCWANGVVISTSRFSTTGWSSTFREEIKDEFYKPSGEGFEGSIEEKDGLPVGQSNSRKMSPRKDRS